MKSVSVIMATFNSGPVLGEYLASIREQDYDQKKIEIVVADGGSTDGTVELCRKYGCRVIKESTGSPEGAKAVALAEARGELVLVGDSDNIWSSRDWLKKMVEGLDCAPGALGVYPWRYAYRRGDSLMNRYFALMGANDPVAWFLGRSDRQSYLFSGWRLGGKLLKETEKYFLVEYDKDSLPTVGANGFLIRRADLLKAKVGEKDYFHIDVIYDLVTERPRRFVVLKTNIVHKTGARFLKFLGKRSRYMRELYLRDSKRRRYFIYRPGRDEGKIALFCLYSLSLVGPLLTALWGFTKKRDLAWFLHPLMCLGVLWVYSMAVVEGVVITRLVGVR